MRDFFIWRLPQVTVATGTVEEAVALNSSGTITPYTAYPSPQELSQEGKLVFRDISSSLGTVAKIVSLSRFVGTTSFESTELRS